MITSAILVKKILFTLHARDAKKETIKERNAWLYERVYIKNKVAVFDGCTCSFLSSNQSFGAGS